MIISFHYHSILFIPIAAELLNVNYYEIEALFYLDFLSRKTLLWETIKKDG
jgi:hypothetical protein